MVLVTSCHAELVEAFCCGTGFEKGTRMTRIMPIFTDFSSCNVILIAIEILCLAKLIIRPIRVIRVPIYLNLFLIGVALRQAQRDKTVMMVWPM
jgi:hypothetical protein